MRLSRKVQDDSFAIALPIFVHRLFFSIRSALRLSLLIAFITSVFQFSSFCDPWRCWITVATDAIRTREDLDFMRF